MKGKGKGRKFSVSLQFIVVACGASAGGQAAIVTPGTAVNIVQSYAYSNFDGGDFVFTTSAVAPGCSNGWYLKPTDGGYRAAIAVVLAAQTSGLQIVVYGDNSDLWAGSTSGQYCRVQTVGLSS